MPPYNPSYNKSWLQQTTDVLIDALFKAEYTRLRKMHIDLVAKNSAMGGPKDGFFFRGDFYHNMAPGIPTKSIDKGNLHNNLIPEMELIKKEEKQIENDKARIKAGLVILLQDCQSIQDVRDAVPNCLAALVPELSRKERDPARKEMFTLEYNQIRKKQYLRIRPLIEYYSVTKLLY